jgi:hypothetical protein
MAQATNPSITSRFHNLSNGALADALGNADASLKGAEAECKALKDEIKRRGLLEAAGDSFAIRVSEQISGMFKWEEQNPTPELRWIEREDDVDGASQKYKAATSAWERKRQTAEAECGYDAAHTAEGAACNEIERLTDALANTPAHSLRAIKIKAAVALQPNDGLDADLAWSIVEDIDRLLTA